jgi:hypothetical protein
MGNKCVYNDGLTSDQRYREKHRAAGLCLFCSIPIEPGRTRCKYHLAKDYVSTRIYRHNHPDHIHERNKRVRERYRYEGRCQKCGLRLNPDMDAEFVTCLNCREGHLCN